METYDSNISIEDLVSTVALEKELGGGLDDWKDLDPFLNSPIKVQKEERWKRILALEEELKEPQLRIQRNSWTYGAAEKQLLAFLKETEHLKKREEIRKERERLTALFHQSEISPEITPEPVELVQHISSVGQKAREMFNRPKKKEENPFINVVIPPRVVLGEKSASTNSSPVKSLYSSSPPANRRSWDPEALAQQREQLHSPKNGEQTDTNPKQLRFRANSFSGKKPNPVILETFKAENEISLDTPSEPEPTKRNRSGSVTLSAYKKSQFGLESAKPPQEMTPIVETITKPTETFTPFGDLPFRKAVSMRDRPVARPLIPDFDAVRESESDRTKTLENILARLAPGKTEKEKEPHQKLSGSSNPKHISHTRSFSEDTLKLVDSITENPPLLSKQQTDPLLFSKSIVEEPNTHEILSPRQLRRSNTLLSISTGPSIGQRTKEQRKKYKNQSIDAVFSSLATEKMKQDRIDQILKRTSVLAVSQISKRSN